MEHYCIFFVLISKDQYALFNKKTRYYQPAAMSKLSYKYNPNNLRFEKDNKTPFKIFLRTFKFILSSIGFAIIIFFMFSYYLDSPKEVKLKNELSFLKQQYNELDVQLSQIDSVLQLVQYRDDHIYRVIFGKEPMPEGIRKAGFGGINRYASMEGYNNSELVVNTAKKLDVLLTQMYIQMHSYREIEELAVSNKQLMECIPSIQPVENRNLKKLSSGFGMRMHPILHIRKFHSGIDYSIPTSSKVFATGNGTVIKVKKKRRGLGNHIVIDHGHGYKTIYAHLHSFNVKKGDKVKRGQVIAHSGNTGFSTAPHLHYEVRKDDKPVNPLNFFFYDLGPEEYDKILQLSSLSNMPFD
ncbi:MAG: peptidase M23 [Marinilabiliales bacterium]|nr:MAG: peptidase M23 [Marinilabiliales bacterium]